MTDHSTVPAPETGAPADRVGSLSARLSEALTAVGIAVRRREAEIELIDRTLAASTDAQSAAARQAADRMARVRAEHAEELQLMQRARVALEDASAVAAELSLELRSRISESEEAVREADALRRALEAAERSLDEQRARAEALEVQVAALSDEGEQTRRALAAREAELEQVWRELDVKSREAQELARLMAAFAPDALGDGGLGNGALDDGGLGNGGFGSAGFGAGAFGASGFGDADYGDAGDAGYGDPGLDVDESGESAGEPPAPPDEAELSSIDAPATGVAVPAVHDVMDELGDFDGVSQAAASSAGSDDEEPSLAGLSLDEEESVPAPPPADAMTTASADGDDDALKDSPVDISVDDWGAVVEDAAAPDAAHQAATEAASEVSSEAVPKAPVDIDNELQAYLRDVGGAVSTEGESVEDAPPASANGSFDPQAFFKATSGISEFRCATPDEVRLAGALQLQSWRPSELAQLLGIEEQTVVEKLAGYYERGLIEVVSA